MSVPKKDIINLLLPIPPTTLIRHKEFPNCLELLETIVKQKKDDRRIGKVFLAICRLTGFAWTVWVFNLFVFVVAVLTFIYAWGNEIDLAEIRFLGYFSAKMLISIMLTLVFVGTMLFHGARTFSLHLADNLFMSEVE